MSYRLRIKALKTLLTTHLVDIGVKDDQGQSKQMSASYLAHKLNMLGVELLSLSCGKVQLIPHDGNFRVVSGKPGLEMDEVSLSCHALLLSPLLCRLQLSLQGLRRIQTERILRTWSDEL